MIITERMWIDAVFDVVQYIIVTNHIDVEHALEHKLDIVIDVVR